MFLALVFSVPAFIIIWLVMSYIEHVWNLRKYPKGPFPLPIIGNLLMLSEKPWIDLAKLSKTYGDIFSLSFGMSVYLLERYFIQVNYEKKIP